MDTEIDDGSGQISAMRVTLRWARALGTWLIGVGSALAAAALVARYDAALTAAGVLAGLGAGLPAAVAGCKAWQAQAEARGPEAAP